MRENRLRFVLRKVPDEHQRVVIKWLAQLFEQSGEALFQSHG